LSEPDTAAHPLNRPLCVAVDARDLVADRRGIGVYVRALLTRFARRDDVALTLLVRDWPARIAPKLRLALAAPPGRRLRCCTFVPRNTDVVWHPWNGTFFGTLRPAVATIHDLIPFALPAADPALQASQQAPILRTAASAHAIVCDSRFTANDVARYLDVAPHRLHSIALGVDPAFAPGDLGALPAALRGRPYVQYVGAHDPHKNVTTLIAAHRRAFPAGDVALVFTRPNPQAAGAIVCENASLTTLVALYRGAAIVAVPSLYEGFGLPVVEAQACGAPVLAARATALPETGGDAAAYVDEPRDVDLWARTLLRLVDDPAARAAMADAGPRQAALFRWDTCARRTFEVLRRTAATQ
jgi:glycosyltransferase involved in cell wall biosynthesis